LRGLAGFVAVGAFASINSSARDNNANTPNTNNQMTSRHPNGMKMMVKTKKGMITEHVDASTVKEQYPTVR
jgi:hypothetical protein